MRSPRREYLGGEVEVHPEDINDTVSLLPSEESRLMIDRCRHGRGSAPGQPCYKAMSCLRQSTSAPTRTLSKILKMVSIVEGATWRLGMKSTQSTLRPRLMLRFSCSNNGLYLEANSTYAQTVPHNNITLMGTWNEVLQPKWTEILLEKDKAESVQGYYTVGCCSCIERRPI